MPTVSEVACQLCGCRYEGMRQLHDLCRDLSQGQAVACPGILVPGYMVTIIPCRETDGRRYLVNPMFSGE